MPRCGRGSYTLRILIAEDDSTSRAILVELIEKFGHEVEAVDNGVDALAKLQLPDGPKLAILDWMMPRMDGEEVCASIRRTSPDLEPYVIMLSIRDRKDDIIVGLESGADDYVCKPYDPEELRARIDGGIRMLDLQARLKARIAELTRAQNEITTLRSMIVLCCKCHKVRNEEAQWQMIEHYLREHADVKFSHGYCDECAAVVLAEMKRESVA